MRTDFDLDQAAEKVGRVRLGGGTQLGSTDTDETERAAVGCFADEMKGGFKYGVGTLRGVGQALAARQDLEIGRLELQHDGGAGEPFAPQLLGDALA
jgi:hypothetical protein